MVLLLKKHSLKAGASFHVGHLLLLLLQNLEQCLQKQVQKGTVGPFDQDDIHFDERSHREYS